MTAAIVVVVEAAPTATAEAERCRRQLLSAKVTVMAEAAATMVTATTAAFTALNRHQ
jgi:hypothetical protein